MRTWSFIQTKGDVKVNNRALKGDEIKRVTNIGVGTGDIGARAPNFSETAKVPICS